MNTSPGREPTDDELDRLLASRLQHTSPEFELRWRELRGELAGRTTPRRVFGRRWLPWLGVATAGVATVALVTTVWHPAPRRPADPAVFEELIAMDAALARATPLLDPESRDALLHLPSATSL